MERSQYIGFGFAVGIRGSGLGVWRFGSMVRDSVLAGVPLSPFEDSGGAKPR
jgi:hypothetical protein